jgi:hypothetical protein
MVGLSGSFAGQSPDCHCNESAFGHRRRFDPCWLESTHSRKHGDAVLGLLRSYNFVWNQLAEAEKTEKARLREEKTLADRVAHAAEAKAVRARATALHQSLSGPPRASWAKKKSKTDQENQSTVGEAETEFSINNTYCIAT